MNNEMLEHLAGQLHWAISFAGQSLTERTKRDKKSPAEAVEELITDMYFLSFSIMDEMNQLKSLIKRFPSESEELAIGQIMGERLDFKKALIRYMQACYGLTLKLPPLRPRNPSA